MSAHNFLNSRRKVVASVAALTFATSMALSGSAVNAATDSPQTGGTLYFVTNSTQLNHIDPARVYTGEDIAFLNSYLFRNLVTYSPVPGNAGFVLQPDLATTTGTPTQGGKTWSWTLKSGIKWSDGSAVTCADEKYGISRAFATDVITDGPSYAIQDLDIPQDASGNSLYAGPYKKTGQSYFDKAVTCNGQTLTVHLNKAVGDFNYFGAYPAMGPVKQSADTGDKYDNAPLSTGPYKIASNKIGTALTLVRNPNWSQATDAARHAYPDQIIMRFGVSEDVRDQIFLRDQTKNAVNYDNLQPQNLPTFFSGATTKNRGMNVTSPYTRVYSMNVAPGHLDCLDIRKAIFFATNETAIIQARGGEKFYGVLGDNVIDPLLALDYAPTTGNIHDPNFLPEGNLFYAHSLMQKAAISCPATYKRVTQNGIVMDFGDTAAYKRDAVLLKSALNAAGIQITFNFIPTGSYWSYAQNPAKEDDIVRSGWAADWPNASTDIPDFFLKDGGFNLNQNYTDPGYAAYKAKIVAAQGETNRAKQAADWKALAQYSMDQYWNFGIVFEVQQFQWGSKVGGVDYWLPQGSFLYPNLYVKK